MFIEVPSTGVGYEKRDVVRFGLVANNFKLLLISSPGTTGLSANSAEKAGYLDLLDYENYFGDFNKD